MSLWKALIVPTTAFTVFTAVTSVVALVDIVPPGETVAFALTLESNALIVVTSATTVLTAVIVALITVDILLSVSVVFTASVETANEDEEVPIASAITSASIDAENAESIVDELSFKNPPLATTVA